MGRAKRSGVFNPDDDPSIEHHRIGVWDLYIQRDSAARFFASGRWAWLKDRADIFRNWGYARHQVQTTSAAELRTSQICLARGARPPLCVWPSAGRICVQYDCDIPHSGSHSLVLGRLLHESSRTQSIRRFSGQLLEIVSHPLVFSLLCVLILHL